MAPLPAASVRPRGNVMDAPAADRRAPSPERCLPAPIPIEPISVEPISIEPWRRRFVRELLYGRIVDRAAKTRARIGLAILVFALGYLVIAARLVMFATAPDGHGGRRAILQDAVGT